jgi:inorganic phosphate transporter, PiT family
VIVASALGLPVSSTHIAVGAVFGVGFFREWYTANSKRRRDYIARNPRNPDRDEPAGGDQPRYRRLVRRHHFMTIIAAWVITVPAAGGLSAAIFLVFEMLG